MAAVIYALQHRRGLRRERIFRDRTNPLEIYTDQQLIARYRFPRRSLEDLINRLEPQLRRPTGRSMSLSPVTQVLSTLRFLAKGDFQSETGDLHGISQASMSRCLMPVVDGVNQALRNINIPVDRNEIISNKEGFHAIGGFPNVVGAIVGTLIPIQGMNTDEEHLFVCRKGFHALNVQAVVDSRMRFTNIVTRFGGATHDAYILAQSNVPNIMETFPGGGWLLGDSGYPIKRWLMTPIANPGTDQERRYNRSHCSTRNIVERSFGVLKARFRCLHKTGGALPYRPGKCARITEACFRLHNKAIDERLPHPDIGDIRNQHLNHQVEELNAEAVRIREMIVRRF